MLWNLLEQEDQLVKIKKLSQTTPQVIFKHSTRCSVSTMIKRRLEFNPPTVDADFYYLDLLKFRPISNQIAELFEIPHESPQILLIRNSICIYNESHNGIEMQDILDIINKKT